MVDYRSVSQVKQYLPELGGCPYQYYLSRIERAWQRPAAWFPQGTAVHAVAEAWEKSGRTMSLERAQELFGEEYSRDVERYTEHTPNFEYWYSSGPYRGEQDTERRYGIGREQVEKYVRYYTETAPDEVIWITPDGEPAIELGFDIDLDGVQVRGFIDQMVWVPERTKAKKKASPTPSTKLVARDVKTGNKPGDSFQLKTYGVAIEDTYGIPVEVGDYWMGRLGKPTKPYDLTAVTRDEVVSAFQKADAGIRAEQFDPVPEPSKCDFCSVATACDFRA